MNIMSARSGLVVRHWFCDPRPPRRGYYIATLRVSKTNPVILVILTSFQIAWNYDHGPNRCRYSLATIKAFTMSALTKLPLNWFSLPSQKL